MVDVAHLSETKRALLDKYLNGELAGETADRGEAIRPAATGAAPLSYAQQQLWFLDRLAPGSAAYNITKALRLRGNLAIAPLRQSLTEIVRRHEALRTIFTTQDGQPASTIVAPFPVELPLMDLRELPESERAAAAERVAIQDAQRPFDLSKAPLLRASLVRVGDAEHVLVIVMHHIVSDGWSLNLFAGELIQIYETLTHNSSSSRSEMPVQYGDYAAWQRDLLSGPVLETQLAYWRRQLEDAPTVLELPTDRPRPAIQDTQGVQATISLPPGLAASLGALSRREGATLFMALLATFQILLGRYTGQDDVIVGAPVAGRTRREFENLIGFFINTVVLRCDLSGNPTFAELLGRVREVCLGAFTHQDVPFDRLVQAVQPERDLSRNPLFDILFNYISYPNTPRSSGSLAVEDVKVTETHARFAMTLYIEEQDDTLSLRMVYQRALFDDDRVSCMLAQYQHLLRQVVANPDARIDSLSLVTPDSAPFLPDPSVPLTQPRHEPVTASIAAWAERTPDAPAISHGGGNVSYRALDAAAAGICQSLLERGVRPGDVVAVRGERSFGLISSMVGVLMSGGVLLTLDRNLPRERQRTLLELAGVKLVLHCGSFRAQDSWLSEMSSIDVLSIEPRGSDLSSHSPAARAARCALDPKDPAYLFFTSGTTGVPKGVLGCHKGLSHFLAWERERFEVGPGDRVAQLTGLSFDVVLRDIFLPLTSGATLVLPESEGDLSSGKIMPWLERERISILHTVPALAHTWLSGIPQGQAGRVTLRHLRWTLFAGEPLTDRLVQRWRTAFPASGAIGNLYGPTETTLAKCFYQVPDVPAPGVQPVGRPLPQTQALVLSRARMLCGPYESGEIVVRTPFRSLGYFKAPLETEKRFVRNPCRDDDDDLIYYTGDRGRYKPDGTLEILGRLDHQVKIRGVRIELGEVESALARHPKLRQVLVVAREDEPGEKRLVAYVVAHEGATVSPAEVRGFAAESLPGYMVPSAIVAMTALPLTPNGKVDRRALPVPAVTLPAPRADDRGPGPLLSLHHQLIDIWESVLNVRPIGLNDDFFTLGGHSLLAVRLVDEVERVCGKAIPLASLFAGATIEHMAQLLLEPEDGSAEPRVVAIQPGGSRRPLFFFHGDYLGGGFYCTNLSRYLGDEQPFHAMQPHGLGSTEIPRTIEAMAADHRRALRAVQPEGPYFLGSFCDAGIIALEVARQLRAEGQIVETLVLIDSVLRKPRLELVHRLVQRAGALVGHRGDALLYDYLRLRNVHTQLKPLLRGHASTTGVDAPPTEPTQPHSQTGAGAARGRRLIGNLFNPAVETLRLDKRGQYQWAKLNYRARPYPGHVALLWAEQELPPRQRQTYIAEWQAIAPRAQTYIVPGTHLTCITTQVGELADRIDACLREATDRLAASLPDRGPGGT